MLANFLEKSKPINFVVYLTSFFCFFLFDISILFFENFTTALFFKSLLFLSILLGIFFFFHFVASKNKLTFDNSYAFFLFTLFIIVINDYLLGYVELVLLLVYLLFIRKIYSLRTPNNILQKLFDSSFWLALLVILQPSSLLFLILIYTSVLLYRSINIRTILTPLVGFSIPLIIYFVYCFWYNELENFTSIFTIRNFNPFSISTDLKIFCLLILLLSLSAIASIFKSPKALSVSNKFKKSWLLINIHFLLALIFIIIVPQKSGSEISFLFFPATIIITNGIELIPKKIIKNIFLGLLILSAISARIFL